MAEIQRRNLYQAQSTGQGYDPQRAGDSSALLRENFQVQTQEQRVFQNVESLQTKLDRQQLDFDQLAENENIQALSGFSKLLQQGLQKWGEKRVADAEAKAEELFNQDEAQVNAFAANQTMLEGELAKTAAEGNIDALKAKQLGTRHDVVEGLRGSTSMVDYFRSIKHIEKDVQDYPAYYAEQLRNNETEFEVNGQRFKINTPPDQLSLSEESARQAAIYQAWEASPERGYNGLPRGIRSKYVTKPMKEHRDTIAKAAERAYSINHSFKNKGALLDTLLKDLTPRGVINYVSSRASDVNKDNKPLMLPGAFKDLMGELESLYSLNSPAARALADAIRATPFNGSTYGKLKGADITEAIRAGRKKNAQIFKADQEQKKAELDQKALELEDFFENNPEANEATANTAIDGLRQMASDKNVLNYKVPDSLLKAWRNHSATGDEIDKRIKQLQFIADGNNLTAEMLKGEHRLVREQFLEEAERQDKLRGSLHKANRDSISDLVTKNRRFKKSFEGAGIADIVVKEFQDRYTADMKNMPPEVTDEVEYGKALVGVYMKEFNEGIGQKGHKYYINEFGEFQNYLPKIADTVTRGLNDKEELKEFINYAKEVGGTKALKSKFLIHEDDEVIRDIANRWTETGEMHERVMQMADVFEMNPIQLLNMRIGAMTSNKVDYVQTYAQQYEAARAEQPALVKKLDMVMRGKGNEEMLAQLHQDGFPINPIYKDIVPATGGLKGLSAEDFQYLGLVANAEPEHGTDDVYGVIASVLNRVASPYWPNTVKEVVTQSGQYQPVYEGTAKFDPEYADHFASIEGQQKIRAAMNRLKGRDSFKGTTQYGNMGPGDVKFSSAGNFYHYRNQTVGSGRYTGPIESNYQQFFAD
jgi:hypothetical protein